MELMRWPGVAPSLAISQVRNTAPYIFEKAIKAPYIEIIQKAAEKNWDLSHEIDLSDYFILLASAHYSTVATFVPTDFDNTIREKLWHQMNAHERRTAGEWVLESRNFDFKAMSERWVKDARGRELHGHIGEWFSMAVAALASNRRSAPDLSSRLKRAIQNELLLESSMIVQLYEKGEGICLLKAVTVMAHNLGDLIRVAEAWRLSGEAVGWKGMETYETNPGTAWEKILASSGELNRDMMATENHRHFSLRKPRCLRKNRELLLPIGPFFDDWGSCIAKHPGLTPAEVGEIASALIDGWEIVGGYGYARALRGIENSFKGGLTALSKEIPARHARVLRQGQLRTRISEEKFRFERRWHQKALSAFQGRVKGMLELKDRGDSFCIPDKNLEDPILPHNNTPDQRPFLGFRQRAHDQERF